METGSQSIPDALENSTSTTHIFFNHEVASAALLTSSEASLPLLTKLGFSASGETNLAFPRSIGAQENPFTTACEDRRPYRVTGKIM